MMNIDIADFERTRSVIQPSTLPNELPGLVLSKYKTRQEGIEVKRTLKKKNDSDLQLHEKFNTVQKEKLQGPFDKSLKKNVEDAQRASPGGGLATGSERVSDNDSNTSGGGPNVLHKIKSKISVTKNIKPMRSRKIHFDFENNPLLQRQFDKVAPEKRLRNVQQLRQYLEKRY